MALRPNSYDADLSMLAYLMVLATVAAVLGGSLYGLWKPHSSPNPGLAAYQAPTGLFMARATPLDRESSGLVAKLAAAEARAVVSESTPEQPKRAATMRKTPQTARGRDERGQFWGRDPWGRDSWGRDQWGRDQGGRNERGRGQRGRDQWGPDQWGNRDRSYSAFGRRF